MAEEDSLSDEPHAAPRAKATVAHLPQAHPRLPAARDLDPQGSRVLEEDSQGDDPPSEDLKATAEEAL